VQWSAARAVSKAVPFDTQELKAAAGAIGSQ